MRSLRVLAGVATAAAVASADQCDVSYDARTDCGFLGITQGDCEAKGCCWRPTGALGAGVGGTPWCFYAGGPGLALGPSKCPLNHQTTGAPFSPEEVAKVRGYFLNNIDVQGSGAVVAAPDHNTGPGGDYYFHWERDGALSMNALLRTAGSLAEVQDHFQHYVAWVEKVQNQPDPHGIDVRTEPKYTIPDGAPFSGGWCRPQTDGPGLRGRTLAEYALRLLQEGQKDFVQQHLWTGSDGALHGGVVKYDLDWVASNWQQQGCDLWEEITSDDFFWGRTTMRAGLHVGAQLAEQMGDSATAERYRSVKADIEKTLANHFDGTFVYESTQRRKDSAVIEAFNDADLGDGLFAPLSKEVLGTVVTLNELFCSSYVINQQDTAAQVPGILYGRYEGDTYDGGNPWVLLSATLAQLIYRQAVAAAQSSIDSETYALLQQAYSIDAGLSGKSLGDALLGAGDGVMLRIKHHVESLDLHMAEQIDRNDGHMSSAKDLTWNYANVLKAMQAREAYVSRLGEASAASERAVVV